MNTYAIPRKNAWNPRADRAAPARRWLVGAPALLFALALASPAAALQQTLTAADGAAGDLLGQSVAVDGDTIVTGAFLDNVGANANQGSASVFFAPGPAPAAAPLTAAPPPDAKPVLSKLKVSPSRFHSGSSPSTIATSRAATKIGFALSEAATVKLSFAKAQPGRSVGKACRRPSRANRTKRPCTRYVAVGSFTVQGQRGPNTVAFTGRLPHGKRLAPGSYKLTATPTDDAHSTGHTRTAKLRITTTQHPNATLRVVSSTAVSTAGPALLAMFVHSDAGPVVPNDFQVTNSIARGTTTDVGALARAGDRP